MSDGSLNSFLGRNRTVTSSRSSQSLKEFLNPAIESAKTVELPTAQPVQQAPETNDSPVNLSLSTIPRAALTQILTHTNNQEAPRPLTVIPTPVSKGEPPRSVEIGINRLVTKTGELPGESATEFVPGAVRPICFPLQHLQNGVMTIPDFSSFVAEYRLTEVLGLTDINSSAIAQYLKASRPELSLNRVGELAEVVERYRNRDFSPEEFHVNYRRSLPAPTLSIRVGQESEWHGISLSGTARDADQLAVLSRIPLRFPIDRDGAFSCRIIIPTDISDGIMIYSINTVNRERSELVALALTPPARSAVKRLYFDMVSVLDRTSPDWLKPHEQHVTGARGDIVRGAVAEVREALAAQTIDQFTHSNGRPRVLTSNQSRLLASAHQK